MSTYELSSVKGGRMVEGGLADAMRAAVALEAELQPAYGVTIGADGSTIATVANGAHDLVVVESMPEHFRASHEAAGNSGSYPHNGAERVLMDRGNAEHFTDGAWVSVLRAATDSDLSRYEYVAEI